MTQQFHFKYNVSAFPGDEHIGYGPVPHQRNIIMHGVPTSLHPFQAGIPGCDGSFQTKSAQVALLFAEVAYVGIQILTPGPWDHA